MDQTVASQGRDYASGTPEPQTYWVAPLEPVEAQTIQLPAPDQIGIPVVEPVTMCFKTTEGYNEASFIEAIKAATAGTVWEIPHLAGSVVWEDEARHRIKLVIPENAKNEVRIKWLPQKDADELDRQHWPPHAFLHSEVCLAPRPTYGIGTYNFGVQANIIRGGVIIVLHMNHTILDGSAQAVVEEIFGHHLSRALDGMKATASGKMPPEALDKSRALGSHPAKPILDWKDWREAPKNNMTVEEATAALYAKISKLSLTVWHIPPEKLAKLRASMQDPSKPKLTMATCLSTWLWRATARARRHSPDTMTRMLTPVQTRTRVPEMHENHTGSALVYGRAKATVRELSTLTTHALGERIAKSVAWWTPERIREYWGSIEECDDIAKYQNNTDRDFGTDVEFTNITNMAFYNIGWGKGLDIRAWRLPAIAFTDAWTIVLPKLRSGGSELMMYLARDTLEVLMKDPVFREYAEYWCASDASLDQIAYQTEVVAAKSKL